MTTDSQIWSYVRSCIGCRNYCSTVCWYPFFSPSWSKTLLSVTVVKNRIQTGVFCGTAPGDWWLITTQLLLKAAGPPLLITAFIAKRRLSHGRSLLEPLPPCKSIKNYSRDCEYTSEMSLGWHCTFKDRCRTLFCGRACLLWQWIWPLLRCQSKTESN